MIMMMPVGQSVLDYKCNATKNNSETKWQVVHVQGFDGSDSYIHVKYECMNQLQILMDNKRRGGKRW